MFSRRKIAKMLGGAPLGLAALGTMEAEGYPAVGGIRQAQSYPPSLSPAPERRPLMSKKDALRLIFKEKHILDQFESALYANKQRIEHIDYDLMSKKSFSMAAKITFQRQRDVARAIKDTTDDYASYKIIEKITEEMVRKLMWPL